MTVPPRSRTRIVNQEIITSRPIVEEPAFLPNDYPADPVTEIKVSDATNQEGHGAADYGSGGTEADLRQIRHQLKRALDNESIDQAEQLYSTFVSLMNRSDTSGIDPVRLLETYEQFLVVFTKLRRPLSTLRTWNHMIQHRCVPRARTWTVMMKGCHYDRTPAQMETIWLRMRHAGVQPDNYAWSTRISGLLRLGRAEQGLYALDEMVREWTAAKRHSEHAKPGHGTSLQVAEPNVVIVNSALSALAHRDPALVAKILKWSAQIGIQPDVVTYNILINVSLSRRQRSEVESILNLMRSRGIPPDSATFTILLNGMFRDADFRARSALGQSDEVLALIDSLVERGALIDKRGYALVLDHLFKSKDMVPAARRVLAHMNEQGITPTAHMYTIMMTHYFQSSPPDLGAVDALWDEICAHSTPDRKSLTQHTQNAQLDTIFYDRMIEGFAQHGDVGRTMAFLARMGRQGKRPGWLAMTTVVKCLVSAGEIARVKQVVSDIRAFEGVIRAGMRGKKGQQEFWEYVDTVAGLEGLKDGAER